MTLEALFDDRVRRDPGSPLVTFYDDETGERAELSAKSLGNWVAKTHFMLTDDLGLGLGDRAFVRLPVHWLAAPILLGCWFAGLAVDAEPAPAAVAFADAPTLAEVVPEADEVFAVSLLSMARSQNPPDGAADYAAAVRPMPDNWASVRARGGPADAALAGLDRAELLTAGLAAAAELGLATGGRLLWQSPWTGAADWITSIVAPLAVGGSVVLVRNPDPAKSATRAQSEGATVVR